MIQIKADKVSMLCYQVRNVLQFGSIEETYVGLLVEDEPAEASACIMI